MILKTLLLICVICGFIHLRHPLFICIICGFCCCSCRHARYLLKSTRGAVREAASASKYSRALAPVTLAVITAGNRRM